jgi:hypothetical protein
MDTPPPLSRRDQAILEARLRAQTEMTQERQDLQEDETNILPPEYHAPDAYHEDQQIGDDGYPIHNDDHTQHHQAEADGSDLPQDDYIEDTQSLIKRLKKPAFVALAPIIAIIGYMAIRAHDQPIVVPPPNNAQLALIRAQIQAAQKAAQAQTTPPTDIGPIPTVPDGTSATADEAGNNAPAEPGLPKNNTTTTPTTQNPTIIDTSPAWPDKPAAPQTSSVKNGIVATANPFAPPSPLPGSQDLTQNASELAAATNPARPRSSLATTAAKIEQDSNAFTAPTTVPENNVVGPAAQPAILSNAKLAGASQYAVQITQNGVTRTYQIGSTVPGLGQIHSVQQWSGGWEAVTDRGIIRQ